MNGASPKSLNMFPRSYISFMEWYMYRSIHDVIVIYSTYTSSTIFLLQKLQIKK